MAFVDLIGFVFRIEEANQTVRVNHVWPYGK
jgi:hypothetical protein